MNHVRTSLFFFLLAVSVLAFAEGVITGTVSDALHDGALPGARVSVRGTSLTTDSDPSGRFRLAGVPDGPQVLEVHYLGFRTAAIELDVTSDATIYRDVRMSLDTVSDAITVTAEPLLEGQAKALTQQKNALNIHNIVAADQIGSFPDSNSAEATQRIPGVQVERDQGEGRYVLVRGTEARLNSMQIDGDRIPAPEGDLRNVALDVIPADLLQSIEVSKALTPDMDGDAIGGTVNMITKRIGNQPAMSIAVAGGYNDIRSDNLQSTAITWGRRLGADDRAGVLFSGSYLNTNRGSDNFEVAWDDLELEELEQRHYTINRKRLGLGLNTDLRVSETTDLFLRGAFNQFDDQEYRRRLRNLIADEELQREIKDRFESQKIISVSAGGTKLLEQSWELDYRAGYLYAHEDEPDSVYTTFGIEDVSFDPNASALQANPLRDELSEYTLDEMSHEDSFTSERDLVAAMNLGIPWSRGTNSGIARFGVKFRGKQKERDQNAFVYEGDDIFMTGYLDDGFSAGTRIIGGRYTMGPFFSTRDARRLLEQGGLEEEFDHESDGGDYDANEDVFAGYAMTEFYVGPRLAIVAGARYESTRVDYTGYQVLFDDEGDYVETTRLTGDNSYGELLPSLHVRYSIADNQNVRGAITRSLARPNYSDVVPKEIVFDEDLEIERGNPQLDVTKAWNLDLMYERYFASVGILSAGVFHKRLDDYIYPFRFEEEIRGNEYEVLQPLNGERATLSGLELAYQNRLRFLPAPFDGFGLYANYTWTDSEAEFPDREGAKSTLPGQARSIGNLALSYEKSAWSARVMANYGGKYISEVGESAEEDVYVDDRLQLDFTASYRFRGNMALTLELLNLTNEPFRRYIGTSDRPVQEEYYSWWGTLGLKWRL